MSGHPLQAVAKRRDRVLQVLDRAFVSIVDADALRIGLEELGRLLPKSVRRDAVYRTLAAEAGHSVDQDTRRRMAWAIAANLKILAKGEPVWPTRVPAVKTTVVVQVLGAIRKWKKGADLGFPIRYRFRIVTGPGAPTEFETVLSSRFVQFIASRPDGLGFARPPRNDRPSKGRPYQHFETLVGMLIKMELSHDEDGRVKVENPRSAGSLLKYNQSLTEMRWRATFRCPFSFTHPCHSCPKGQTSCPAATHPLDHEVRLCPQCLKNEEFDLFWDRTICRRCCSKPRRRNDEPSPERAKGPDDPQADGGDPTPPGVG